MKHNIGISVYPDIRPLDEIKQYFALASKYGVTRVFSSMFSVEGTKEEVLAYFKELIEAAHSYNLQVSLDVNPYCFKHLGASPQDLSVFKSIDVDILRMDMDFGPEGDKQLIENPYGITIEFSSAPRTAKALLDIGCDPKRFIMCHNFYPQRYTGLRWEKFLRVNREIKAVSKDIRNAAFVSSHNENTHGVWDAKDGLPTVERLRDYPMDLQARILLATNDIDDILIGNAYASEDELKALYEVVKESENTKFDNPDPILKALADNGIIHLDKGKKLIKVDLDNNVLPVEEDILFNFVPHLDMGDSSEWIWRSRMPRFKYSKSDQSIPPRHFDCEFFEKGDVMIVNDNYKHYAGEIQIVRETIVNDGTRNRIGHISDDEYTIMELVHDSDMIQFLKK